jgi:hypothetical protein
VLLWCVQEQQEEWVKKLKFHASLSPAQQLTSYSSLTHLPRPEREKVSSASFAAFLRFRKAKTTEKFFGFFCSFLVLIWI